VTAIPLICIVGRSGVGKTTLLEKLIPALKERGYKIATIKHHAHPGFDFDKPGKDTWRHAQAGSDHVIIAAPDKVAAIRRVKQEPTLDELAATITDVDLILTEGYKRSNKPKIEVIRATHNATPLCTPQELIALATDVKIPYENLPQFDLNDVGPLRDFLIEQFLANPRK